MTATAPFQPRRTSRPRRVGGLLVATLITGLLVWRFSARRPSSRPHEGNAGAVTRVSLGTGAQRDIGITYAPVLREPLEHVVRSVGIVAYDESRLTTVTSKVDGWVERLAVSFTGERVRNGQTLLSLYSPELVAAQEELLLARRLLTDLAQADGEARRGAEDLLAAARRRLENWDLPAEDIAALEASGAVRKTLSLRSRASGFAVEKSVQAGQRITAGEPLYRLADLAVVWVEGDVYERDLPLIRLGDPVRASFTALPGSERQGKVGYIYPTVNSETRTIRVRVEFGNADLTLRPGMYATLAFENPGSVTLSIPRSAALVTGTRTLVFLKCPDGRFEPREVTLGAATDTRYEVLKGLAPGDTVVASGTFLLDAESNLGTMLGGMGGMPGMSMGPTPPPVTHKHE